MMYVYRVRYILVSGWTNFYVRTNPYSQLIIWQGRRAVWYSIGIHKTILKTCQPFNKKSFVNEIIMEKTY